MKNRYIVFLSLFMLVTFAGLAQAPVISSFTPTSGGQFTAVTITGTNFSGATSVKFGGVNAASFIVQSPTQIRAFVGAGASGSVTVTNASGTGSKPGFVFAGPLVNSFLPVIGAKDTVVTIKGINFTTVNGVWFGNVAASSFTILSDTVISAVVGPGASGSVLVTTPSFSSSKSGFTHLGPQINAYTPRGGPAGTTVTLTGLNFSGVTAVSFGGIPAASFTVVSPTTITAVSPAGGSGVITATSIYGTGTASGYNYPKVNSFSPVFATYGMADTIRGSNFTGATAVSFGSKPALSFTVLSDTVIRAIVGTGADGRVKVTNSFGADSLAGFGYYYTSPVVTSFTPTSGFYSSVITIKGSNFSGINAVSFGGVPALSYTVVTDSLITATVNTGNSGSVSVGNLGGTGSLPGFSFLNPSLQSFSPTSGSQGTAVTIKGQNLTTTTAVFFGSYMADSIQVLSDTTIFAYVGIGSTGNVTVIHPGGSSSLPGFTFTGPYMTSFSPNGVSPGDTVQINGTGFVNVSQVKFGGVPATYFTVLSPTLIKAVVGNGNSGSIEITNPLGTFYGGGFYMKPVLQSFSPASGKTGDTIVLQGKFLTQIQNVKFGGVNSAYVSAFTDTLIRGVVGTGASGFVSVTTPGGTDSLPGFIYYPTPSISGFSPAVGNATTPVTITGTNLQYTDSVFFGGIPAASFTIVNNTTLLATPAASGATGNVTVKTKGGTVTLPGFTFYFRPQMTSFSPQQSGPYFRMEVRGSRFTGLTKFKIANVEIQAFALSDSVIQANILTPASGFVYVETPGGKDSLPGFVFKPVPVVQQISPASAPAGASVTITGSNFSNTPAGNVVMFGGVRATVTAASATSLTVTVPAGVTFKPVSVMVNGLTGYSKKPFVVTYAGASGFSFDSYGSRINLPVGFNPKAVVADIDGDGKLDLVVSQRNGGKIWIYRNTSTIDTITFAPPVSFSACTLPVVQFAQDANGDGKPDLMINCEFSIQPSVNGTLFQLINTSTPGNISFAPGTMNLSGMVPKVPILTDVNADGRPDIPVSDYFATSIGSEFIHEYDFYSIGDTPVYQFNGYIPVHNGVLDANNSGYVSSFRQADMNSDGKPDFVVGLQQVAGSGNTHYFTILQNSSSSLFYVPQYTRKHYNAPFQNTSNPLVGDLNGDSLPDILRDTVTYINLGNFNFSTQTNTCVDCEFIDDMDGDGKPDLVKFANDTFAIVRNKTITGGAITLSPKVKFYAGRNASHYDIGDLNGDGKPEIIISRYNDSTITILKNKVGDIVRLCAGGSTTLTSNISGGSYQWQINTGGGYTNLSDNATYAGTQTPTLSLSNLPDSMNGYRYRCMVSGNSSYIFTLKFENTFTGAVSNAWENPGNWSCGTVPTQYTDVIINGGSNVILGANGICQSLTLLPGSSLTVLPGFTLTIVH